MKTLLRTALAATAILCASPAFAADAFTSFNGTNGNGGFGYGYSDYSGVVTLTPFTNNTNCVFGSNSVCLNAGSGLPQASIGGGYPTVLSVADYVVLHPGDANALSVYGAYTAGSSGSYGYTISLKTLGTDSGTGVGFTTFTSLAGVVTLGSRAVNSNVAGSAVTFSGTQSLAAGQSFGIIVDRNGGAVDNNGGYGGDSTGLNFSIGAVPEPATWAMMLMGFGMVGFGLRSKRNARMTTLGAFA